METRHFIKTLCKQKVMTFYFKHSYRIKRQVGTTLKYSFSKKTCMLKAILSLKKVPSFRLLSDT